jgi:hypothetical protein
MSLKELQGPLPGCKRGRNSRRKEAGAPGGGELTRIRGSRIANDLRPELKKKLIHGHIRLTGRAKWCDDLIRIVRSEFDMPEK